MGPPFLDNIVNCLTRTCQTVHYLFISTDIIRSSNNFYPALDIISFVFIVMSTSLRLFDLQFGRSSTLQNFDFSLPLR